MKKTEKTDILKSSAVELTKKVSELKKQIVDETLKRQSGNVKNTRLVKSLRAKLAVALTAKRMAELTKER